MKIQHLILTAILASSVSAGVYAENNSAHSDTQTNIPMMQGPQGQMPMGYYQGQPMNPMMMQRMMHMRQQNMQMLDSPENMPMSNMMRHRQQMMGATAEGTKTTQQYNCPMHQMGEKRMGMMQQKQEMMQAHMVKVESHLANIEALLRQIAEKQ